MPTAAAMPSGSSKTAAGEPAAPGRVEAAVVVSPADSAADSPCLELAGDGRTVYCSGGIPGRRREYRFRHVLGDESRPEDDSSALVRGAVSEMLAGRRTVIAAIGAVGAGKTRVLGLSPPFGSDGMLQAAFRYIFADIDRRPAASRPRVGLSAVEVDGHELVDLLGANPREPSSGAGGEATEIELSADAEVREEQLAGLIARACGARDYSRDLYFSVECPI